MNPRKWPAGLVVLLLLLAPGPSGASTQDAVSAASNGSPNGPDRYWPKDGNGGTDALHYDVRVRYDFESQQLGGSTTVRMRATQDLRSFSLDFLLPVRSVKVDGRKADFSTSKRHEVRVVPRKAIASGVTFKVKVAYRGNPAKLRYAGEASWLADRHEVVTMNEPHMAPWWFPSNDHPTDKATFDIRVSVPRDKQVISNGVRVKRTVKGSRATTHWRTTDPMATYLAYFAAGDFAIRKGRSAAGIPYFNAVSKRLPGRIFNRATRTVGRTAGITDWLQARLGGYPFASTGGLVTSLDVGFALENQTRPTYGRWIYRDVVVHELAHQWFGDSVSVARWSDIWINEGLASYMEADYDAAHGGPSVQEWYDGLFADLGCRSPDPRMWRLDLSNPGKSRVFHVSVYVRGAMVLAALADRIGEADLLTLLRTWVAEHRNGNATVAEFEELAQTVSGEDLDGFFDAWLRSGAVPALTADNGLDPAICSRS